MKRVSAKRKRSKLGTRQDPVYQAVDARSRGRCEGPGCLRLATDHHHCVKPRASHHEPHLIVALCRRCHEQCNAPYAKGRLVVTPEAFSASGVPQFRFRVITASDKFAARARGA